MSIHENLATNDYVFATPPTPVFPITYHQQDNLDPRMLCGAACAQMVLESLQSGEIDAGHLDQDDLYWSTKTAYPTVDYYEWDTAPDSLVCKLNASKPTTCPMTFKFWHLPSEEAISRKICWTIHRYGVAPLALVFGGDHWVVVTGYSASRAPESADDTLYDIEGFDVFDPSPATKKKTTPPPHIGDGSDECGTGYDAAINGDRGDKTIFAAYNPAAGPADKVLWRDYYMKPLKHGCWTGEYAAICDTDPPAEIVDTPPVDDMVPEPDPQRRAVDGIYTDFNLDARETWSNALKDTYVGEPLLVEREDLVPTRSYYLVPFPRQTGEVPVVALVDGYQSGGLVGSIAVAEGTTHLVTAFDRDKVIHTFSGTLDVGGVTVELTSGNLYDTLVWRPCKESLSLYWPFYRFDADVPGGGTIPIYVRIDGELFTELHEGMGM